LNGASQRFIDNVLGFDRGAEDLAGDGSDCDVASFAIPFCGHRGTSANVQQLGIAAPLAQAAK